MSSSRRWERSSNAVCPELIDITMERQRSSRPAAARSPACSREQLLVVDLIEHDRRVAFDGPYLCGTAALTPLRRIERDDVQQAVQRSLQHRPDEHDVDQIAIVKDRRGFGDAGLVAVRFGAFDHQRLGVMPSANAVPFDACWMASARRSKSCPHRRVLGRIERPVAHGGEQRARELQQPLGELG
jgi:hypothetical protein